MDLASSEGGWELLGSGPGRGQLPRCLGLATVQTPSPVRDWCRLGLPPLAACPSDPLAPSLSLASTLPLPSTPGASPPKAMLAPVDGSHGRPGRLVLTWLSVACAQPPPGLTNTIYSLTQGLPSC